MLLTIGGFQVFISVYVMTGGKPLHRTDVLLTYMYSNAFEFLDLGYSSALAYLFALMVFALSMAPDPAAAPAGRILGPHRFVLGFSRAAREKANLC